MTGSRDVKSLHPELQNIIFEFLRLCAGAELPVLITETIRSVEYQNWLFAQGRTRPGAIITNCQGDGYQSGHQWGVAFDFCRNVRGLEFDTSDGFFQRVGIIGEGFGLTWGGRWKTPDMPHFEMLKFMPNSSTKFLKDNFQTPERFMLSWFPADDSEQKNVMRYTVNGGRVMMVESINVNGSNYPKLRPLMDTLGIKVSYDAEKNIVLLMI